MIRSGLSRDEAADSLRLLFANELRDSHVPLAPRRPASTHCDTARSLDEHENGAIARLLDACDLAGVGYEEMQDRIRRRQPAQPQEHTTTTTTTTPRSPSPRQYAYTALDPSWQTRAENLSTRYNIPVDYAATLLTQTGGHAGRASRLIEQEQKEEKEKQRKKRAAPSTSFAPSVEESQTQGSPKGKAFQAALPPLASSMSPPRRERERERGGQEVQPPPSSPSPQARRKPSLSMSQSVPLSRAPSLLSRKATMNLAESRSLPGSPLSRAHSATPTHCDTSHETMMSIDWEPPREQGDAPPAPVQPHCEQNPVNVVPQVATPDPDFDFIAACELLDPIGNDVSPGMFICATRREWGCVAFFTVSSERYNAQDPLTWEDVRGGGGGGGFATPDAFILYADITEVICLERTTHLNDNGQRSRSKRSEADLGMVRFVNPGGMHIRVHFPPLQYSDICTALKNHVNSTNETPFAPTLAYNAELYRDGVEYYPRLAEALIAAEEEIYIAGWYLSPHVFLSRDGGGIDHNKRLDNVLQRQAFRGVKVYVLLYAEVEAAIPLASANAALWLEGLHHSNIQVLRHRGPIALTHHQKFVVIDGTVGFVGGLDLTWGRYDTHSHDLFDDERKTWVGYDYRNPILKGDDHAAQVKSPFVDALERSEQHRMPWHDVQIRVCGKAAYDIGLNFIQRWNQHLIGMSSSRKKRLTRITPILTKSCVSPEVEVAKKLEATLSRNIMSAQVVRSMSEWSGAAATEKHILTSMIGLIQAARHTVYIENQFFISSAYGAPVVNGVGAAIADRINKAAREKQCFRCVLVLQPHGEGSPATDSFIQRVIHFQSTTLRRLAKRVKAVCGERADEYLQIACLRNWGTSSTGVVASSTIYVHSKLLIVDDEVMVIGSANINDRSLMGERDSELALVVDDCGARTGKIRDFRHKLLEEHMGEEGSGVLAPSLLDEATWKHLCVRMQANSKAFEAVMPDCPTNKVTTADQAKQRAAMLPSTKAAAVLATVKGHICTYPLDWLSDAGQDKSIAERAAGTDFFV